MSLGDWVSAQGGKLRRSETRLGRREAEERGPWWGALFLEGLRAFWARRGRLVVDLALIGFLSWVLAELFLSTRFFVYRVESAGNIYVPVKEIFRLSGVDEMSIFYLKPADIQRGVEDIPNIRAARVRTRLPARVLIDVEEYQPIATWQTGRAEFWASEEGKLLPVLAIVPEFIRLVDTEAKPVEIGASLPQELTKMLPHLQRLQPEVWLLQFSRGKGISFVDESGARIYLGLSEELEEKLASLALLGAHFQREGVEVDYIDLSVPGRIYYRPAGATTNEADGQGVEGRESGG